MQLLVHAHSARTNTVKRIILTTNMLAKKKKKKGFLFWADLLPEQAHCSESCLVASESHNEEYL